MREAGEEDIKLSGCGKLSILLRVWLHPIDEDFGKNPRSI